MSWGINKFLYSNESGPVPPIQVVGYAGYAGGGDSLYPRSAFLWDDGATFDLNALIDPAWGWVLSEATAINALGQIAATACRDGACHAVRLDLAMPVPEPATWTMLLGGGVFVAAAWLRRRLRGSARPARAPRRPRPDG